LGSENIYQLPENLEDIEDPKDIPLLPSPESLKYKYIVKCKAKRRIPKCNLLSKEEINDALALNFSTHLE
jgi:hypothetical protein